MRMAPEEMAAVLQAPNQLCYFVFFHVVVTYFVHNVFVTVFYDQKQFLDIRTAFTHLKQRLFSLTRHRLLPLVLPEASVQSC